MTRSQRSNLVMASLAIFIIILDQWTKTLVRQSIPLNTSVMPVPWLAPYVSLTHILNAGAAFGLGQGLGKVLVFTAFAAVFLIVVFFRRMAERSVLLRIALGLQLGGAIGNLIDRLARGGVTDFVDLGWFPIFNVADSAITIGTILLGIYALFFDRPDELREAEAEPDAWPQNCDQTSG